MTDEPRDDEMLGRALARAIETQYPNETAYERSRIALRAERSGADLWQWAGSLAVLGLALVVGFTAWSVRNSAGQPVAASTTPSPSASPAATATAVATASASASPTAAPASATPRTSVDHNVVYFARDGRPPVAAHFDAPPPQPNDVATRIRARLAHLWDSNIAVPQGASNAAPPAQTFRDVGNVIVAPNGDATVDLLLSARDWGVRGASQTNAFLQQLVYTVTEEPGVSRVLFTQDGGKRAVIDQVQLTKPLAREDVFGYSVVGPLGFENAISMNGSALPVQPRNTSTRTEVGDRVWWSATFLQPGADSAPAFIAWMSPAPDDFKQMGKYILTVVVGSTSRPSSWVSSQIAFSDETPLRATMSGTAGGAAVFSLLLDDARPWRAYTESGPLATMGSIAIEIGGDPRATSDRITVTTPRIGMALDSRAAQSFAVAGLARVFEANVSWRLKAGDGKVLASGHTTASLGSSALWGSYSTDVPFPAGVTGNVTLEVFEASPKDGSDVGLVAIPLTIR